MDECRFLQVIQRIIGNTVYKDEEIVKILQTADLIDHVVYLDVSNHTVKGWVRWEDHIASFVAGEEEEQVQLLLVRLDTRVMRVFHFRKDTEAVHTLMENTTPDTSISAVSCTGILDLNMQGRRWEGGILNGCQPHGYGILYNEQNCVEAECFMYKGKMVGFGTMYYNNRNQIRYEGGLLMDLYCGRGVLYDGHGHVNYAGLFYNHFPLSPTEIHFPLIHSHLQLLTIDAQSFNDPSIVRFSLEGCLLQLIEVVIGPDSLKYVHSFILDGLPQLCKVQIGAKCGIDSTENGWFHIRNCPTLKDLTIYQLSFRHAEGFLLTDLISLERVRIGRGCFSNCHSVHFERTYYFS